MQTPIILSLHFALCGLTTHHHQSQADPKDPLTYGLVFFNKKPHHFKRSPIFVSQCGILHSFLPSLLVCITPQSDILQTIEQRTSRLLDY